MKAEDWSLIRNVFFFYSTVQDIAGNKLFLVTYMHTVKENKTPLTFGCFLSYVYLKDQSRS